MYSVAAGFKPASIPPTTVIYNTSREIASPDRIGIAITNTAMLKFFIPEVFSIIPK